MLHCPICGVEVSSSAETRFGEAFCSPSHAEEFVEKVRAARIQAAAALSTPDTAAQLPATATTAWPKQRDWKHYFKMGACVGVPLLGLVFLAGGGGTVLGAAGALLPALALLACPLAMYFMMRGMSKMGHQESPRDKADEK